jgi:hypothetical protein
LRQARQIARNPGSDRAPSHAAPKT